MYLTTDAQAELVESFIKNFMRLWKALDMNKKQALLFLSLWIELQTKGWTKLDEKIFMRKVLTSKCFHKIWIFRIFREFQSLELLRFEIRVKLIQSYFNNISKYTLFVKLSWVNFLN